MNYCTECGKPTDNGLVCEDCMVNNSPWLLAMKIKENDLEQKIAKLKAENAELRERLDKAVELPAKVGDTVYLLSQTSRCPSGEIVEAKIIDFIGWKDGYRFTAKGGGEWFSFLRGDIGTWVFTTRETAEACLKELKEKSND